MLSSLLIKNYALIESIDISFDGGLSVITGETGAGKSIVIGALGLLLGERASADIVRVGSDKTVIEGTFGGAAVERSRHILDAAEIESHASLMVRREVSAKGVSRAFINDTPVPISTLKELGDVLVDLHGQHEHQSLLRPETHGELLDAFAGVERNREVYQTSYRAWQQLVVRRKQLSAQRAATAERLDVMNFQAREIDAVAPLPGEDTEIESLLKRAEHGEQLFALTAELNALLYDGETTAHDLLSQAAQRLASMAVIDPAFEALRAEAVAAIASIDEIASFARRYHEQLDFDPTELEAKRARGFAITGLKKKYGGSLDAVLAHRAEIEDGRASVESFEKEMGSLERLITEERTRCADAAKRLSRMRHGAAPALQKSISSQLKELGIADPAFVADIAAREAHVATDAAGVDTLPIDGTMYLATSTGIDIVEFLISTNAGLAPRPLVKVASGGEISRVMLAMKSALATIDRTPVLIFDEIDVGISGRIAQKVGVAMRALAEHHQVIAITHLPQIAGKASAHFVVEKHQSRGATITSMRRLAHDERVTAVAALLSGDTVTEASLKSARELIKE